MEKTCTHCNGSGVKTDDNGIQYDDPCEHCIGKGRIEEDFAECYERNIARVILGGF